MEELIMRLPPGFRFHPTDEELVLQYLRRKALSVPLPASVISEVELGKYDPSELPGCYGGEKYFFSHLGEARYRRAARSGYWKATGKDKPVVASGRRNEVVGMKRVLVFFRGKPPRASRTDWIMHEYRLAGSGAVPASMPTHCKNCTLANQGKDWVVCRVFKKESAQHHGNRRTRSNRVGYVAAPTQLDGSDMAASSSCSSCVTDTSDQDECSNNGEEASSKQIASSP
ncbi:NAC domain-containing protein 83-like isoform X2 [Iris pallida]|uniref:NAC domain-containing protein 83-like isoform X2 n=1 Tax=Iris pallida TaxID=29817 RepID=A0AAX6HY80_IRIPA|nr:NAC domain-containing protein 83-like isoform X2 [Iris pallida]